MKYDLKGHPDHSSTLVYGLILVKICMNATNLKYNIYVMDFFTLRPSDLRSYGHLLSLFFVLKHLNFELFPNNF